MVGIGCVELVLRFGCYHLDYGAAVGHAGGETHQDGHAELFGQVERVARHVVCFLLVARFETRDESEVGIEPRVLLVLAGVHRRVVGCHNNEAAVGACDGGVDERVGADVHAHMFHADHGTLAGVGDAERLFHRGLFVG